LTLIGPALNDASPVHQGMANWVLVFPVISPSVPEPLLPFDDILGASL